MDRTLHQIEHQTENTTSADILLVFNIIEPHSFIHSFIQIDLSSLYVTSHSI